MNKYSVDYNELEKRLEDQKVYKYADVKHRLERVGYDIVRFRPEYDNTIDGLWQIQATDDGEVIVAVYDPDSGESLKSESDWDVVTNKSGSTINIFYKNEPVTRIASARLGISNDEVKSLCADLPHKLASNKELRHTMLKDLSKKERSELLSKYPELKD